MIFFGRVFVPCAGSNQQISTPRRQVPQNISRKVSPNTICPVKCIGKRLSGTKVTLRSKKSRFFANLQFSSIFEGFEARIGFETWRIRIRDPFYMQIASRTLSIEVEILKIAKIMKIMVLRHVGDAFWSKNQRFRCAAQNVLKRYGL